MFHHRLDVRADAPGPVDQPGRVPALDGLVGRGHVGIQGGVVAPGIATRMAGHAGAAMEQLDDAGRQADIDLLPGEAVGHRVVMADHLDVIVDADPRHLPFGKLVAHRRQRSQGGPVQFGEGGLAAARQLLEGPGVEPQHEFGDGPVDLVQAEETLVTQPRQHPAFDQEHAAFDLGLVLRPARPGGQHHGGVMAGQVTVGRVDLGVVEAGGGDATLQVVGDQQRGDAAQMFESADVAADPVGQALAPGGFAVGVVGGAQHGDEDGGLADFAGHRVDDGHGRPGVVDEQLLAWGMGLAQAHREAADPVPVVVAEAAVAIAVGVLGLVLLPEQVEGDALAPQFAVHGRPVGFGPGPIRWRCRRVQLGFQFRLAGSNWQRPGDADLLGTAEHLAHRRRRGLDRPCNLATAAAALVVQAENFKNLAHG